ncbi:MAG TPA: dihydroxyacetone kinase phosphoryl donor subunit DhaM [Synergistales bacterium]|nr:dihydroxyacetone kinase phosphoryl donor subunit DhaM [Synergistaceae bacterium]NLD97138.1 PTS mannose transporter subunit IID [Synergistaceae bacterium]HPE65023.1 dihydroxyacetone kinase phosphoryl donor subunit DhaM [Synergistales bacterium]HRV97565.1 dihydroxyacetone kinase phosphoryl donor subunit DhaM [Aminobacteriaceae bacterium]
MNAILVVSHSAEAARGIVAIASQMAGERVGIAACGGTDDGELGTSVPSILSALEGLLETSDGVLVIPDLGSAVLAARTAKDLLGERAGRVLIADGPVLEGTLMASVEASVGAGLDRLAAVVDETRGLRKLQE